MPSGEKCPSIRDFFVGSDRIRLCDSRRSTLLPFSTNSPTPARHPPLASVRPRPSPSNFEKGRHMLHVFTLFSVPSETAGTFIRSIRIGGEWHARARRLAPDRVATDLPEHRASSTPFLCNSPRLYTALDLWTSPEGHCRACRSAELDPTSVI